MRVTTQKHSKNQTTWYVLKASALTTDGEPLQFTERDNERESASRRRLSFEDKLSALGCDECGVGAMSAGEQSN